MRLPFEYALPMDIITSRQNPLIKTLRHLRENARARRESGKILLEGIHLIQALQQSGRKALQLIMTPVAESHPEIRMLLSQAQDCHVSYVAESVFKDLSDLATPTGVLALANKPTPTPDPEADACILLDEIQDPGNVGSILRTAAAAGVRLAYLSPGCADPWAPRTLRAGMGAQLNICIMDGCNLPAIVKEHHYQTLATTLEQSVSVYDCDLRGRIAFIFGNEGAGVSPALLAEASLRVHIPMEPGIESLNVAAAAAICLFERRRQLTH